MEKCIGCELCAGVCPADCIYVRGLDNPPDHPVSPGERYGYVYEINYLRCIHCDMCVEACPTEAITESKLFEFSFTNRDDAIYTKDELLVDDDGRPRHLPWEDWREGDDLTPRAGCGPRRRPGHAAFEGEVQWSGELGFGVRAPEGGQSGRRDDAATGTHAAPRDAGAPPAPGGHAAGQAGSPGRDRPGPREGRAIPPRLREEAPAGGRRTTTPTPSAAGNAERDAPAGPAPATADDPGGGGRHDALLAPCSWPRRPTLPDVGVFAVAAAIVLAGAIGVVVARNPVHSALMLVMTLFGVAVLFVLQRASFLPPCR